MAHRGEREDALLPARAYGSWDRQNANVVLLRPVEEDSSHESVDLALLQSTTQGNALHLVHALLDRSGDSSSGHQVAGKRISDGGLVDRNAHLGRQAG